MADPAALLSLLAAVFGTAEGALSLGDRLGKVLQALNPDDVVHTATQCLRRDLTDNERTLFDALPVDARLESIKEAIRQDIENRNWQATLRAVAGIVEQDWGLDKGRAQALGETFQNCLQTALVRLAPNEYGAVVIADRLGVIEELIGEATKRPGALPIPSHEHDVRRLLRDYLSGKYPFVGREALLKRLTELSIAPRQPQVSFVLAEAGRGKTALLSHLFFTLTQKHADEAEIVFIPISHRYRLSSKKAFFERLYAELASITGRNIPEAGTDLDALRTYSFNLLEEAADLLTKKDQRLVIILDGLDEAEDFDLLDIAFPGLHANVRYILSARPMPSRPTAKEWLKELGFDPRQAFTLDLEKLSPNDVREALAQARETLSPLDDGTLEEVARELYRLTDEGDPLLLRLYLESLDENTPTIPKLTPAMLRELKPGLGGFFDAWLKALEGKLERRTDSQTLRRLTLDLFTLLAYAKEALEREELFALLRILAEKRGESFHPLDVSDALVHAGRFLVGQPYALQHPRLNAYFREMYGEADPSYRHAFLAWGEQALEKAKMHGKPIAPYFLRFLSAHLADEDKLDTLASLVTDPHWYKASTREDPTRNLLARDLDRLLQHANDPQFAHLWVADVFYRNVLRMNAENLPPAYFGALSALGRAREALTWAELLADPGKKASAITEIADHLPKDAIHEKLQFLKQLATLARSVADGRERAKALIEVARALATIDPNQAKNILGEAWEAAEGVEDKRWRLETLVEVAKALAPIDPKQACNILEQAHKIAESIEDEGRRAEIFAKVAIALALIDPERARNILDEAREAAEKIKFEWLRAEALAEVAKALAPINPKQARETAEGIEDNKWRAIALAEVAKALAPIDLDQTQSFLERARETAESIEDKWWRAVALVEVARALIPLNVNQARKTAGAIEDKRVRAVALVEVAKALAPIDPERAQSILEGVQETAEAMEDKRSRAIAHAEVAKALITIDLDRARNILDETQETAESIEVGWLRAEALARVAKALITIDLDQARNILDEAQETAESIEVGWLRAEALAEIAKALAPIEPEHAQSILERAQKTSGGIVDKRWRIELLVEVAKALITIDPEQARNILDEAQETATSVEKKWLEAELLVEVTKALITIDPEQARNILDVAQETAEGIEDNKWRTKVLIEVAKALAPIDPEQAYLAFREAKESARAWGATYEWFAVAFPTLAVLNPEKALQAYERYEQIRELLYAS